MRMAISWCFLALELAWFSTPGRSGNVNPPAVNPAAVPTSTGKKRAASVVPGPWHPLFDGRTLRGWHITGYERCGAVEAHAGGLVLHAGDRLTGVNWTNAFPRDNYEIGLEAYKEEGSDFFCGLTFPVKQSFCTLIVDGWGGGVVGLSSIDGHDASKNQTTSYLYLEPHRWYSIRLRVTSRHLRVWLEGEKIIDVTTAGHRIGLRPGEIEKSVPLGLTTFRTTAILKDIRYRRAKRGPQSN